MTNAAFFERLQHLRMISDEVLNIRVWLKSLILHKQNLTWPTRRFTFRLLW